MSISVAQSNRQDGIETDRIAPVFSLPPSLALLSAPPLSPTSNPIGSSSSTIFSFASSVPSVAFTRSTRTRTGRLGRSLPLAITVPGARLAVPTCAANSAKRSSAISAISGSTPRSKRAEASLRNPKRREVRLIVIGSHQAASINAVVVDSDISVDAPPITPAKLSGSSWLPTIKPSCALKVRVSPSSVTSCSPSRAIRTARVLLLM